MPNWIIIGAAIASFSMSALIGFILIPFLKKIHFGQTILEDGPKWHKSKQGTPIMGGFMFIISSTISSFAAYLLYRFSGLATFTEDTSVTNAELHRLAGCVLFSLLFAGIGFIDDYIKAVKKQNLGLKPKQKMIMQFLVCAGFLTALFFQGDHSTEIDLIFVQFDIGFFYYPLMIVFMIYVSNAVNLTDGVDGLCGSVTFVSMLAFSLICVLTKAFELSIFSMAVSAGCLGFLLWNLHPAKCFMGDTGSMFLGGAFVAVGVALHNHLLIVLLGLIYILEALSVVIQVTYFKYTAKAHFKKTGEKGKGKRIFKMSPIHHHFELSGFSEYKIVITFSLFTIVCSVLGVVFVVLNK